MPSAQASEGGLVWLLEQQQNDGRIVSTADETTTYHATFESLRTLHLLSHDGEAAFQAALHHLEAETSPELSFLARRLIVTIMRGDTGSELPAELARYQNPDGGFSSRPGRGSSLLDTIEALEAFSVAGMKEAAVVQPALNYLLQRQHADGGFSPNPSSPPSVYLTSRALLLLQSQLFDYNLSGPLQGSVDFLLQRNQAGALWGESWESAQALLALIPAVTDATRYDDSVAALSERQNASGSWDGSVYATALSLRAIHLAEQREAPVVEPVSAATGSITGRVQDAATGLPLAGGRVTLPGTDFGTLTRDNGGFELGELPPGEHTVEFVYAGYAPVLRQVRVEAGRYLDMGIVLLHPLLDSGLLRGFVTDGVSGALMPGALVAAVGAEQVSTMTGADGGYQLELGAGETSITVTADDYEPVTVNATVIAGAVLNFSPTLLPAGTEPESTLTLRGRVLDSFDGTPIAGALVTSPGWAETATGHDGIFLLEGLAPAAITMEIQANGYQGVQLSLLAEQGGMFDLGDLRLTEYREPPPDPATGTIKGRTQDGVTGLLLAGTAVTLQNVGHQTLTGADGGFELSAVEPGEYIMELAHTGYDPVLLQMQIEAGKRLDLGTIVLQPRLDSGLLQGTVTDGDTGAPVIGAVVEAMGEDHQAVALTYFDGGYQIELPEGLVLITVSAEGYQPVTANGNVTAGAILRFSPALRPVGAEPDGNLTLKGRVLDSADGSPVSGAHVSAGPVETLTGDDGAFLLEELVPAELILAIQADGYLGVSLSLLADQGGLFDLGGLRLARIELPETSTIRGTVNAADSGEPIAGALLTVAGESAESDDAGRFVIEGIESLNFELAATAPGYHARRYAVELAEHGRAELAVVLQPASYGGIAITALTAERSAYPAYSQVLLNAALENRADSERLVRLHLRVLDSQGGLVDEFGVTPEATGGIAAFSLAPGAVREAEISWYNRHYPPDTYTVWLQVHDAASAELLVERTARVVVEETRWLEYVRLAADPHQANQGASEAVRILLSLRNRSNVPLTPGVTYEWRDPDGMLLHADTAVVEIDPRTTSATLTLASLEWNFARAGSYPFKLIGIEGVEAATMEAGTVEVAPDIRIELRQNLAPEQVLPQGDSRLRMRIRIEGVQAP